MVNCLAGQRGLRCYSLRDAASAILKVDAESVQPPEDTAAVRQAGLGVPTLGTLQDVGEFLEFLSPLPWTQALGGLGRSRGPHQLA